MRYYARMFSFDIFTAICFRVTRQIFSMAAHATPNHESSPTHAIPLFVKPLHSITTRRPRQSQPSACRRASRRCRRLMNCRITRPITFATPEHGDCRRSSGAITPSFSRYRRLPPLNRAPPHYRERCRRGFMPRRLSRAAATADIYTPPMPPEAYCRDAVIVGHDTTADRVSSRRHIFSCFSGQERSSAAAFEMTPLKPSVYHHTLSAFAFTPPRRCPFRQSRRLHASLIYTPPLHFIAR